MTSMSRYLFLGRKEAEFYSQKSRKRAERGGSYMRERTTSFWKMQYRPNLPSNTRRHPVCVVSSRKHICLIESTFPIAFVSSLSGRTTDAEVGARAHFADLVGDVVWITR